MFRVHVGFRSGFSIPDLGLGISGPGRRFSGHPDSGVQGWGEEDLGD